MHEKSRNQYFGKVFEQAICNIINKTKEYDSNIDFLTDEEIAEIENDAHIFVNSYDFRTARWIGNLTICQDGDLIIDDKTVEIKYVSSGTGTYFNTSLHYVEEELGFIGLIDYLFDSGVYKILEEEGLSPNREGKSPFSAAEGKKIASAYPEITKAFQKQESTARKQWISEFYSYLLDNPEKMYQLINFLLGKGKKNIPDIIYIYNYKTKTVKEITKNSIQSFVQSKTFDNKGLSFTFDCFRVAIGWQNRNGFNNPTFRVFL